MKTHCENDLFGHDHSANLLPMDGLVQYHGAIMNADEAAYYEQQLLNHIPWVQDEVLMYGKRMVTARKVAWVGNVRYAYTYSGTTKHATPWTADLLALKARVEALTATTFNSCLLNLYHTGAEGMGWHSDDEAVLVQDAPIASLSLGATRKFAFRHKSTQQTVSLMLEAGSLLVMAGNTQTHWRHSLLKSKRVHEPRINLTFRSMVTPLLVA